MGSGASTGHGDPIVLKEGAEAAADAPATSLFDHSGVTQEKQPGQTEKISSKLPEEAPAVQEPISQEILDTVSVLQAESLTEFAAAEGCSAVIKIVSAKFGNSTLLGKAGACAAVIRAIRDYPDSAFVAEQGFMAVSKLSDGNKMNEEDFGANGACELIVSSLKQHLKCVPVAEQVCSAIRRLTFSSPANRKRLVDAGCAEMLVEALRARPVNLQGCMAVVNLASNSEGRIKLGESGVCIAIIDIMMASMKDNNVIERICAAVGNLALEPSNKVRLAMAGGCQVVIDAIRNNVDNSVIVENGMRAAINLAANNPDNNISLGSAGACEVIVNVLKNHPTHGSIVAECCKVILNLMSGPGNKEMFKECGLTVILHDIWKDPNLPERTRQLSEKVLITLNVEDKPR